MRPKNRGNTGNTVQERVRRAAHQVGGRFTAADIAAKLRERYVDVPGNLRIAGILEKHGIARKVSEKLVDYPLSTAKMSVYELVEAEHHA